MAIFFVVESRILVDGFRSASSRVKRPSVSPSHMKHTVGSIKVASKRVSLSSLSTKAMVLPCRSEIFEFVYGGLMVRGIGRLFFFHSTQDVQQLAFHRSNRPSSDVFRRSTRALGRASGRPSPQASRLRSQGNCENHLDESCGRRAASEPVHSTSPNPSHAVVRCWVWEILSLPPPWTNIRTMPISPTWPDLRNSIPETWCGPILRCSPT